MLRYKNGGYMVEVKIPGYDNYYAVCIYHYNRSASKYALSMWLKNSDFDDMFKIDWQHIDTQLVSGTKETIRENICKIVEQASINGFFDKYIHNFEYTYKCFDIGNSYYEEHREDACA